MQARRASRHAFVAAGPSAFGAPPSAGRLEAAEGRPGCVRRGRGLQDGDGERTSLEAKSGTAARAAEDTAKEGHHLA